ncbi:MAG: glutamate--tRNA ligase [Thermodesulfobacteriota bacterium]|nr:MAG: glutamate--tRNA ligase [Thermodesulfobacteriota bacterium]
MTVRTRFGPSPTGTLHLGGARTALFNFLFARHSGGSFVLRIEDTDRKRSRPQFESSIMEDLRWLGLDWDEGPLKGGDKGPYRQSERTRIYRDYAERLLSEGLAYRCYCSRERLEELNKRRMEKGLPPRYDGRCIGLEGTEVPEGVEPALRFRVGEAKITFTDLVHGPLSFDTSAFGDFIIISSGGTPSYNFAAAVDDSLMEITHVIRGDDHLSNTPRQILLCEALGLGPPLYCHVPLVLGPDRTPLGKRREGASINALREEGFLPGAVLNAAARLGWSPGEDFLTLEEMAKLFTTEKLSKSPSIFDSDRLKSFNKKAIAALDTEDLLRLTGISFPDREFSRKVIEAVRANAETLKDIKALAAPFTGEVSLTQDAALVLKEPHAKEVIKTFLEEVERSNEADEKTYNEAVTRVKEKTGVKGKTLFMPLRSALTGATVGIELVKIFTLLGKERVVERLSKALG